MIDEAQFRDIQRTEAFKISEIIDLIDKGNYKGATRKLKLMEEEKKWRALEKVI
jgi:hypothetical protein